MRIPGILALTHSSRRCEPERCSVQFLTRRFSSPDRLRHLPPFASLPPAEVLYSGAVSFFRVLVGEAPGRPRLRPLGRIQSRDRIQHLALTGGRDLWVGFEHRLEHWRLVAPIHRLARLSAAEVTVVRRLEHPHLAGLHTVEVLPGGRLAVSCSALDAVLILDPESGEVEETLRLPASLYGRGYDLEPGMDLRRHYICDELQTTHVNAAFPLAGGRQIAVSTLIPGAVGVFDRDAGAGVQSTPGAEYRELLRGFVGCHGARADDRGRLYFSDSATGTLVFPDQAGRIARRFAVGSTWLHDSLQLAGSVYAFALADQNELRLYDLDDGTLLARRRFPTWPVEGLFRLARRWPGWVGNSVQALAYWPESGCQ